MIEKTIKHIKRGLITILIVNIIGIVGYMVIEKWDIIESFYMTILTISTTGFQEVRPLSHTGRIFTTFMIITGVTSIAYTGGRALQFLVETQILRRRRMSKRVEKLKDHYIICGFGRMGRLICNELNHMNKPFVVIEKDPAIIEPITELEYLYVHGSSTKDDILVQGGGREGKRPGSCLIY